MPYALSTQGQGATAYAALPLWAINPNTQTGVNWIEIDFILHEPADNGIGYIFGASNSTIFSVSVDAANKLRLVLSSAVIIEPVGTFVYGQRYTIRLEYNDTGSASTAWTRLYLNGAQIGSDYTGATSNIQINQIARYSTTRHSPITIFSLKTGSSTPGAVGYVDEWNDSTALGTGTTWPSVASTRNITITNATGAADSWWINYGGSYTELASNFYCVSNATAELSAGIQLGSLLEAESSITAAIEAAAQLTSTLYSVSAASGILSTEVRLAAQLVGNSTVSAQLLVPTSLVANINASATLLGVLTTGIRLSSSLLSNSYATGTLSDAAPTLPPQFTPVIVSITPYSDSAIVVYSYPGVDVTAYKGRINGGAAFTIPSSPAIITGLTPETTYDLELAAENSVGLGAWSAPVNFTTTVVTSSNDTIIRNIVRPYLRPVVKEVKK